MTDEQIASTENVEANNDALPNKGESEDNVTAQQPTAEATDNDYEDRARMQGWKPKEEYGGDPKGWVDAQTYVDRADNELPVAKATIRKLESEITQVRESFERMRKFKAEKAKREALEASRVKHTKAIDDDGISASDALNRYEQERSAIEKQYTEEVPKTSNQPPVEVQQWIHNNPWANATDDLGLFAQAVEHQIGNTNPSMPPLQILNEVKKRAIQAFPSRFENPNRRKGQSIEGGGTVHSKGAPSPTAKFNRLTGADQQLANQYIREGLYKDKAAFIKDYESMYGEIK